MNILSTSAFTKCVRGCRVHGLAAGISHVARQCASVVAHYRADLKLRTQNNLPDADPIASYCRQDAAMTAANAYAPPPVAPLAWEEWPAFGTPRWW